MQGLVFGMVLMCLTNPNPAVDECKVFYVTEYNTTEECLAGIDGDVVKLEAGLPMAKAEDKICLSMNRKPNA